MRRTVRRRLGLLAPAAALAGLLGLLAAVVAAPAAAQDDLASVRQRAKATAARVAEVQARADRASAAYFESESRLGQIDIELAQQEAAQSAAAAQVERLRADLREFVVDQYTGRTDQFLWFNMSDINQGLVQQELSSISAKSRAIEIDDYRAAVADLEVATNQLQQKRNARKSELDYAATIRTQLASELTKLTQEKQALDGLLARLEAQEAERIRQELKRQQDENRRRAEEAARARTTTTTTTTTTTRRSNNPAPPNPPTPPTVPTPTTTRPSNPTVVALKRCPVQGGASFTDTYGQARGGGRLHIGVDLSAPVGTPVVAPVDGVIGYSGDGAGGLTFTLSGADGNFYYGAHLHSQGPSQGRVAAGAPIGTVGMTGNASVPHLHFEIHVGGRGNPINPTPSAAAVC